MFKAAGDIVGILTVAVVAFILLYMMTSVYINGVGREMPAQEMAWEE